MIFKKIMYTFFDLVVWLGGGSGPKTEDEGMTYEKYVCSFVEDYLKRSDLHIYHIDMFPIKNQQQLEEVIKTYSIGIRYKYEGIGGFNNDIIQILYIEVLDEKEPKKYIMGRVDSYGLFAPEGICFCFEVEGWFLEKKRLQCLPTRPRLQDEHE
jgi:hypothetical protein